jgi:hypothetical protein
MNATKINSFSNYLQKNNNLNKMQIKKEHMTYMLYSPEYELENWNWVDRRLEQLYCFTDYKITYKKDLINYDEKNRETFG